MSLTGVNRYVDTSATYNGDGTDPAQATSDGGAGAYNSIQSALSAAPNAPSTESERWLIWVRRLDKGAYSSITSTLSPTNDGSYNAPHMLTGFPFRTQQTGLTVDSVPSGTDSFGINKAKWQFVDAALTEGDNYWIGAEVEFTSGSNSGLKRTVIWFDSSTDTIYLDFPLPNDIAASDQYTITLETEHYNDRPSEAQSLWDGDTNTRPVIDGGGGSFSMFSFYGDLYWQLKNFELQNLTASSSYDLIGNMPYIVKNVLLHDAGSCLHGAAANNEGLVKKVFLWNFSDYRAGLSNVGNNIVLEDCHFNLGPSGTSSRLGYPFSAGIRMKNCTFGRITTPAIALDCKAGDVDITGENIMIGATTPVNLNIDSNPPTRGGVSISGYNGEPDKFHVWKAVGEVYNVNEDATVDPPSGAATYIRISPNTYCNDNLPLFFEEQHYQASGAKTYTWSFRPAGWAGLGTSDIEVEAWYLDETSGTHRNTSTANPATVTNDTWNNLTITINPGQAGTVYFKIKLKLYESGAYIALDPKVDIS